MDATSTVQIPRVVVNAADPRRGGTDSTMVLPPGSVIGGRPAGPPQQFGHPPQQAPHQRSAQHNGQPHHSAPTGAQPHSPTTQPLPAQPPPGQAQQRPNHKPLTRRLPGLVPTVQQTPPRRPSLAERLNGELVDPDEGPENGQREPRRG
jgi:hypothetical protein